MEFRFITEEIWYRSSSIAVTERRFIIESNELIWYYEVRKTVYFADDME